jgi:hypothetical protein
VAIALLVALVNAAPFKSRGQQQQPSASSPFYYSAGAVDDDDDYGALPYGASSYGGYNRFGGYPSYYGHNPYSSLYGFNRQRPYGYSAPSAYGGYSPYAAPWGGSFGYPQNPFRYVPPQVNL